MYLEMGGATIANHSMDLSNNSKLGVLIIMILQ